MNIFKMRFLFVFFFILNFTILLFWPHLTKLTKAWAMNFTNFVMSSMVTISMDFFSPTCVGVRMRN